MISSPRMLRPFTVTLIHKIDDKNFVATTLKHVGFDENYGIKQANKGISNTDNVLLTIDLSDCGGKKFVDKLNYPQDKDTFTIGNEDYFVIGDVEETDFDKLRKNMNVYSIEKFTTSRPISTTEIQFIEIYAT